VGILLYKGPNVMLKIIPGCQGRLDHRVSSRYSPNL
jgi:hypothetical protein